MSGKLSQASDLQSSWTGRSHVSTFVHCLHLLNLDRLQDWPGLTEQTFTAKTVQQNLQHRIRAVEWSLYRLFELYDASETKDKLRPFFPPVVPLQSLNLRAALYRFLTELKKNGVLGREILLRKTMLDECKGDKFEETIAAFAMIVLRKTLKKSSVALSNVAFEAASGHTLPLILAYRKSLQDNLNRRNTLLQEYMDHTTRLNIAEQVLDQRSAEVRSNNVTVTDAMSQQLQELVNTNWIGDQNWANILLYGPPIQRVPGTEKSCNAASLSESVPDDMSQTSLLLNKLDARINRHEKRLAEWKLIAKGLESQRTKPDTTPTIQPAVTLPVCQRFTKHKEMYLSDNHVASEPPRPLASQFQLLLNTMRDELSNKGQGARSLALQQRRALVEDMGYSQSSTPDSGHSNRDMQENVPITTEQGTLGEETSRTMHSDPEKMATHVEAQHSPFPSSPVSSLFECPSSSWIPEHKSSTATARVDSPSQQTKNDMPILEDASNKQVHSPSSPTKDWLSLLDRTRASMANFGGYKHPLDSDPPDQSLDSTNLDEAEDDSPLSSTPPPLTNEDNTSSLLERTRQSMSLLAMNNSRPRRAQNNSRASNRASQSFPVNQFETSEYRVAFRDVEESPVSGASTPRDKLFDTEADYASVFKSRPKIAQSPSLSPERSGIGLNNILEQRMKRLDLLSEDEA